jgi:hypothetical protein
MTLWSVTNFSMFAAVVSATAAFADPVCHVDPYRVSLIGETNAWVQSGGSCTGRFVANRIGTLEVGNPPAHGTLTAENDTWHYTPNHGYKGPDPFTILINFATRVGQLTVHMEVR